MPPNPQISWLQNVRDCYHATSISLSSKLITKCGSVLLLVQGNGVDFRASLLSRKDINVNQTTINNLTCYVNEKMLARVTSKLLQHHIPYTILIG